VQERFVVAAGKKVVGVAVRVRGGYRFFCSDPDFQSIDSRVFPRARALARHVADFAQRLRAERKAQIPQGQRGGRFGKLV
jgi:hypothetical protein